ncbi:ABC-type amino acid transport substrate-binding protein [Paraburkholderia sp. EB58]
MDAKAPDGSVKGFDVDLGNEICRRIMLIANGSSWSSPG